METSGERICVEQTTSLKDQSVVPTATKAQLSLVDMPAQKLRVIHNGKSVKRALVKGLMSECDRTTCLESELVTIYLSNSSN